MKNKIFFQRGCRIQSFCFPPCVKKLFPSHSFAFGAFALFASLRLTASTFTPDQLDQSDVRQIVAQAATEADRIDPKAIIAVTDRDGFVLAIWDVAKRLPTPFPAFDSIPFPPAPND